MDALDQLRFLIILFCWFAGSAVLAQTGDSLTADTTGPLAFIQPNVPPQNVRTMGEWEEVEGLVIAWDDTYEDILTRIVRNAVDECLVYIINTDFSSLQIHLIQSGISQENIRFITTGFNSVWIRDYGPWTVYLNKVAERGISDYLYNRPNRTLDDQVPYEVADYIGSPLYNADENPYRWTHSGGNFLRDGVQTAYSSDLVLRENSGKTGQEIAEYARVFFGIEDYRILSRLNYDTIHHLDMHMRTLDEETIAIGEYPPGVADGPVIEANLAFLRNHYRTPYGKPYRILRLPMPPQGGLYPPFGDYRTYTNSVFVNKTILVPTYAAPTDSIALQLYRDYFPGYRIVGINCNDIIDELGALHCITKLVGVPDPLWIAHPRLRDTYGESNGYPVDAWVYHESGIHTVTLYYRASNEEDYQQLPMMTNADDPALWQAIIPSFEMGTQVQYYLEAVANNGKRQLRPLPAPVGYYHFRVKPWAQPPTASWVQTLREVAPGTEVLFTNDSEEGSTSRYWSFPGGEPVLATEENAKIVYPTPGSYAVRLVASNPVGSDTLLRPNSIRVRTAFTPFTESFTEDLLSPWEIINPDNGTVQWQWLADGACTGPCLEVPHRQSPEKLNREYLRTAIDLRGFTQTSLQFAVSYAQRNAAHFDELRVNLVDQEGQIHNIYNKGGEVLATVTDYLPGFTPTSCQDWRTESINLSSWEGQQFILEIESIGDRGNSIFLDELTLVANALPVVNIAFPANNTLYLGTGPLQQVLRVEASDPDGEISEVAFFMGSEFLGVDTDPPYEMPFQLFAWGDYTLQARATDNEGAQVWSESITVHYDYENSTTTLGNLPLRVSLMPNPVSNSADLLVASEAVFNNISLSINNAAGQLMATWLADVSPGTSRLALPVEGLAAGSYWLQLRYEDQQLVLPVVKL